MILGIMRWINHQELFITHEYNLKNKGQKEKLDFFLLALQSKQSILHENKTHLKSSLVHLELSEPVNGVEYITPMNSKSLTHPTLESRDN